MSSAGDTDSKADVAQSAADNSERGWAVRNGDVVMPVERAEWWGSSLGVLVAAIHHPHLIAALQPDADPVAVARQVLDQIDELRQAADAAEAGQDSGYDRRQTVDIQREGDAIVISPGDEVRSLGWCLEVFAGGVLDPAGRDATMARGATGYAASAWSGDIGRAAGTLPAPGRRYLEPPGLAVDGPDLAL